METTPTRSPGNSVKRTLTWLLGGFVVGVTNFVALEIIPVRPKPLTSSFAESVGGAMVVGLFFGLMSAQISIAAERDNVAAKAVRNRLLEGLLGGVFAVYLQSGSVIVAMVNAPGVALIWGLIEPELCKRRK